MAKYGLRHLGIFYGKRIPCHPEKAHPVNNPV